MDFFVDDVKTDAISGSLHLGDQVGHFLDGLNLEKQTTKMISCNLANYFATSN
jgi:hypothetical protein